MKHNLHISYDLIQPDKNYERVIAAIKSLGSWAKIHYSYWYVSSNLTPEQAANALEKAIDANDTFYIVDATSNQAAWHNLDSKVSDFIRERWQTKAA